MPAQRDTYQHSSVCAGLQGQLHAVWKHRVSKREAATIVQAQIPVLVLHGRHDILAMPCFGEQLAHRSSHCPDCSPMSLHAVLRRWQPTWPVSWTWQHCSSLTEPA